MIVASEGSKSLAYSREYTEAAIDSLSTALHCTALHCNNYVAFVRETFARATHQTD